MRPANLISFLKPVAVSVAVLSAGRHPLPALTLANDEKVYTSS
jgi:hypothetical protein